MKKLVLKKDVVARINNDQMNYLRGGAGTYGTVLTCGGSCTCGAYDNTCWDTCNQGTCKDATCVACNY